MRRTQWWGVAVGVMALAGATFVAPSAMAATATTPHKPRAVKSAPQVVKHGTVVKRGRVQAKTNRGRVQVKTNHGKPGQHGHKPPEYPPGRGCSVSIALPDRAHKGQSVKVATTVAYNKQKLAGVKVALYNSNNNGAGWKLIATTTTDSHGNATFSYLVNHDALVRIVVAGNDSAKATQSESAKITLKR